MNLHPDTLNAHHAAITTLTTTDTTTTLAAALAQWRPLDKPGFPDNLPDGNYFDGYFFATKTNGELAITQIHALPPATHDLWGRLVDEQRAAREQSEMTTALAEESRGPGRPPVGKPFPVRLPAWRRAILAADSATVGVKEAELVRWLINQAYGQLDRDARDAGINRTELIRARLADADRAVRASGGEHDQ